MKFPLRLAAVALLALPAAAPPPGQPPPGAPATRPVVVELFTSQGCSSCPPADAFLSDLARSRADVLPLGLHITYWNSLGWRDPFALDAATERQRRYAASLPAEAVYTPQMVVDGTRDVVGSDRAAALAAIAVAAASMATGPALHVARDGAAFAIDVAAGTGVGGGRATVWLVGYDRERRTAVGRGENAGRSLVEANIVRDLVPAGEWTGAPLHLRIAPPQGERAAVIIQAADGRILNAARVEPAPAG